MQIKNAINNLKNYIKWLFRKPTISFDRKLTSNDVVRLFKEKRFYELSNLLPKINNWTRKKSLLFLCASFFIGLVLSIVTNNPLPILIAVIGSISYGTEATFNNANTAQYKAVIALDSTHFVINFCDSGDSGKGKSIVGTISGTTITFGSEYSFDTTGTVSYITATTLDSTHFVVCWRTSSGTSSSKVGVVSNDDEVAFGSAYQISGYATTYIVCKALDSTHFVVAYYANSSSAAKVGVVSSGDNISYGSEYQFSANECSYKGIAAYDSTHFLIAFYDAVSTRSKGIIGVVSSGDNISYGSEVEMNEGYSKCYDVSADELTSTTAIVAFKENYNDDNTGYARVATFSSTDTLTWGNALNFETSGVDDTCVRTINSTTAVVCYRKSGSSGEATATIILVSGTTLTKGDSESVNAESSSMWSEGACVLDSTHFAITYGEYSNPNWLGRASIGLYSPPVSAPTVTVQAASSIEQTTATGNGNITDTGGENCTKRGFVYGTTTQSDPGAVAPASSGYDSYAEDTGSYSTGAFTKGLTSLTAGTKYYIRAYAYNPTGGYNYSDTELTFITDKILTETVSVAQPTPARAIGKVFSQVINAIPSSFNTTSTVFTQSLTLTSIYANVLSAVKVLTDSIIVNPVFDRLVTAYKVFVESIVAIPSILNQSAKIFVESIVSSDTYQKVLTAIKIITEAVILASNTLYSTSRTFIEVFVVAPVLGTVLTASRTFTEAVSVIGSITRAISGRIFSEVLNMVDLTVDTMIVFTKTLSEAISIVEATIEKVFTGIKVLSEEVKMAVIFLTTGVFYKVLTDIITATDSVLKQTGRIFVEAISVVSNKLYSMARVLVDSFTTSDSIIPIGQKVFSEIIKVADSFIKDVGRIFIEVVQVVSTIANQTARVFTEVFNVVSSKLTSTGKLLIESLTIGDLNIVIAMQRVFSEVVNIADNIYKQAGRIFSEVMSIVDPAVERLRTLLLSEVVDVVLQLSHSISRTFTESVIVQWFKETYLAFEFSENIIIRTISVPFIITKTFIESFVISPAVSFVKTQFLVLTDVLQVIGSFTKNTTRVFTERLVVVGSEVYQTAIAFIETVAVSISDFTAQFGRVCYESFVVVGQLGSWAIGKIITQTVKVYDTMLNATARIFSEALSVVDNVVAIGTKLFTEIVSMASVSIDWLTSRTFVQSIRIGDVIGFLKTQFKILTDSFIVVDSILRQIGRIFVDSIQVVSTFALGTISKVFIEPFKVIASYVSAWTLARVYSEAIKVVDNVFSLSAKIFVEAISVVSTFIVGTISKVIIEVVKVYDVIARSLPKTFTEAFSVVGNAFNQGGKIFAESLSVAGEFILGTISKLFVEPVIMAYQFITGGTFYKVLSEAFSVSLVFANQAGKIFVETVSVVGEFILGTISKVFVEVVKVYDGLTFAMTRVFEEVVNVSVAIYNQGGKIFTETVNVVLTFGEFVIGKVLIEVVSIGESLVRTISRTFTQVVSVVDQAIKSLSGRVFSENPKVVNPNITKLTGRTFSETVVAGWAKIKLVLNGIQVGLWKKIARVTNGVWRKISRNDN